MIRKRRKNILRYWIEFYSSVLYVFYFLPPSGKPAVIQKQVREKIGQVITTNVIPTVCKVLVQVLEKHSVKKEERKYPSPPGTQILVVMADSKQTNSCIICQQAGNAINKTNTAKD